MQSIMWNVIALIILLFTHKKASSLIEKLNNVIFQNFTTEYFISIDDYLHYKLLLILHMSVFG